MTFHNFFFFFFIFSNINLLTIWDFELDTRYKVYNQILFKISLCEFTKFYLVYFIRFNWFNSKFAIFLIFLVKAVLLYKLNKLISIKIFFLKFSQKFFFHLILIFFFFNFLVVNSFLFKFLWFQFKCYLKNLSSHFFFDFCFNYFRSFLIYKNVMVKNNWESKLK